MNKFWAAKANRGKKKGFTLIELIVVIAILAILAAIMVPLVSTYIADATKATGDANARAVYSAAAAWAANKIADGGFTGEGIELVGNDLKLYFGNTDGTIEAKVDKATGAVKGARYTKGKTYYYPAMTDTAWDAIA